MFLGGSDQWNVNKDASAATRTAQAAPAPQAAQPVQETAKNTVTEKSETVDDLVTDCC